MFFKNLRKNLIPPGEKGITIRRRFEDGDVCRRCGKCCHQGFVVGGQFVLIPELPCKYLAKNGDEIYYCKVYETRNEVPWCNPCNEKTVKQGLFPPDCSYVQGVVNYHGKSLSSEEDREKVRKALRKRVKYMPRPDYIRAADWTRFLKMLYDLCQK